MNWRIIRLNNHMELFNGIDSGLAVGIFKGDVRVVIEQLINAVLASRSSYYSLHVYPSISFNRSENQSADDFFLFLSLISFLHFPTEGIQVIKKNDSVWGVRENPMQIKFNIFIGQGRICQLSHIYFPHWLALFVKDTMKKTFAIAAERCYQANLLRAIFEEVHNFVDLWLIDAVEESDVRLFSNILS